MMNKKLIKIFFLIPFILISKNSYSQVLEKYSYDIIRENEDITEVFYFDQRNYPSPFGPSPRYLDFRFGLPDSSNVRISLFNFDGKELIIIDTNISKGCYYFEWGQQNYNKLNSGMHYCIFESNSFNQEISSFKKKLNFPIIK